MDGTDSFFNFYTIEYTNRHNSPNHYINLSHFHRFSTPPQTSPGSFSSMLSSIPFSTFPFRFHCAHLLIIKRLLNISHQPFIRKTFLYRTLLIMVVK